MQQNHLLSIDKTVLSIIFDGLVGDNILRVKYPLSYFLQCHLSQNRHLLQDYWRFFRMICCLLALLITNIQLSPSHFLNVLKLQVFLCRPCSYSNWEMFFWGKKESCKEESVPTIDSGYNPEKKKKKNEMGPKKDNWSRRKTREGKRSQDVGKTK